MVDENGQLLGVLTRTDLLEDWIAAALTDGDDAEHKGSGTHHRL